MMTRMCIPTLMVLMATLPAGAQDGAKAVTDATDVCMDSVREGGPVQMVPKSLLSEYPNAALAGAAKYLEDASPKVRHFSLILTHTVGNATDDKATRQTVVNQLLGGLNDGEPLVWQHAAKFLMEYESGDFDDAARAAIEARVLADNPTREDIRLAGVARLQTVVQRLGALLLDERAAQEDDDQPGRWYGSVAWAARLVRARLGVESDAAHAIAQVESEPDIVTRAGVLFKDLAFIDRPATLQVLSGYVRSDAMLPSAHPPKPGSPVYQYAIDALAEFAEGFPFEAEGPGGYSDDERRRASDWLDERVQPQ